MAKTGLDSVSNWLPPQRINSLGTPVRGWQKENRDQANGEGDAQRIAFVFALFTSHYSLAIGEQRLAAGVGEVEDGACGGEEVFALGGVVRQ
jgi:hypothetical protein